MTLLKGQLGTGDLNTHKSLHLDPDSEPDQYTVDDRDRHLRHIATIQAHLARRREEGLVKDARIRELEAALLMRDQESRRLQKELLRLKKGHESPAIEPDGPLTAEDFAAARFAEVDGRLYARLQPVSAWPWIGLDRDDHRDDKTDSNMADLAREGRARIIREAPTDPAALIDLAWETAHVVPEGVKVPPHTPCMERSGDWRIAFAPDGLSRDADAHGSLYEIRTLAPLPAPRPEGAAKYDAEIRAEAPGLDDETVQAIADRIARKEASG